MSMWSMYFGNGDWCHGRLSYTYWYLGTYVIVPTIESNRKNRLGNTNLCYYSSSTSMYSRVPKGVHQYSWKMKIPSFGLQTECDAISRCRCCSKVSRRNTLLLQVCHPCILGVQFNAHQRTFFQSLSRSEHLCNGSLHTVQFRLNPQYRVQAHR